MKMSDLGPATWQRVAPAAEGLHQSPIDIKASDVIYDAQLNKCPLSIHYDPASCKTLVNNGHSLQVVVDAQDTCKLHLYSLLKLFIITVSCCSIRPLEFSATGHPVINLFNCFPSTA